MADEQDRAEALDEDNVGEFPPDKLMGAEKDDPLAGEPSTRDVATEKGDTRTAEESAMHLVNEELPDFDSEVDDPALERAWELDPEVER